MVAVAFDARRRLILAIAGACVVPISWLCAQSVDEFGSTALKGAGSTFAHPLMSAWAQEYRAFRKGGAVRPVSGSGLEDEIGGVALDYEAVGSQAGIQRLKARAVDFAVSEMPLPAPDLQRNGLLQVPLVAGAVALAVNLGGAAGGELRLSPKLIVDIFLGKVKTWDDAAIAALNPNRQLPAAVIAVVHRADGSGTTFTFTNFLSQTSAEWKRQVGNDLLVNWPVGEGFKGNAGVARALERTPSSIGYLNFVQVSGTKLAVASVQNGAQRFVAPSAASVEAAVAAASWDPASGFNTSLVNLGGENSYPIVAAVFGLADDRGVGRHRTGTRAFFNWSLTLGKPTAEKLGYVALPPDVVQKVLTALR